MQRFWYTTAESEGQRQFMQADNLPAALLKLRDQGVVVKSAGLDRGQLASTPPVNEQYLIPVYEQLASLLAQGTELSAALGRIAPEATNQRLRQCLTQLATEVADGLRLNEAMAHQPHVFAPLVISTVAAAEVSGDLAGGLRSLSSHQQALQRIGADLALPLAYPVFLLTIIIVLIVPTLAYIWPQYMTIFADLGLRHEQLPLPTLLVDKLMRFLPGVGTVVAIAVVGLVIFYLGRMRTRLGRLGLGPRGLPIPLFGRLARYAALARATGAMRLLLANGVPAGPALRLSGEASGHRHVSLAMRRAEETISEGGQIAEGLRATGLLPDAFVFTLSAAEASGDLLSTLEHLRSDYMQRVKTFSHQWVVLAGPIVVVILGLLVAVLGGSMFAPLVEIISQLSE